MKISDTLLPEFDHEMATTRRVLERVPEDRLEWTPHEKSMSLGRLAGHLCELPGLGTIALSTESMDPTASGRKPLIPESRQQLLDTFDRSAAGARAAIAAASNEDLMQTWTLHVKGKTLFSLPRVGVLRTLMMSHMIHHRGQLSVYLRLTGTPVPSIYGPSADEGNM